MQVCNDSVAREGGDDVQKTVVPVIFHAAVLEVHRHGVEAVVGEHDALRRAGRAAREGDARELKLAVVDGLHLVLMAIAELHEGVPLQHTVVVLDVDGHFALRDPLDQTGGHAVGGVVGDDVVRIQLLDHFLHRRSDRHGHHDAGIGALHELLNMDAGIARIEHQRRGAQLVERVQRDHKFRDRDRAEGDDVALLHAQRLKGRGALINVVQQLAVGDAVFKIADGNVVTVILVDFHHVLKNGFLRKHSLLCLLREKLHPRFLCRRQSFRFVQNDFPLKACPTPRAGQKTERGSTRSRCYFCVKP